MYLDKMKDKWKNIAISLAVIIVIAGLIFSAILGYVKVTFSHYEDGFKDGTQNTLLGISQIIEQQGFVHINSGNKSMILALVQPAQ